MRKTFGILALIASIGIFVFFYAKKAGAAIVGPDAQALGKNPSLVAIGGAALFQSGKSAISNLLKEGTGTTAGAAVTGGSIFGKSAIAAKLVTAGTAIFVGWWASAMTGKLFGVEGLFGRKMTNEEFIAWEAKELGWTQEEAQVRYDHMMNLIANGELINAVSKGSLKAPEK